MPILLKGISRRDFLVRSLSAAALVASHPLLAAGGKKLRADTFALMADIHISGDPSRVTREVNMTDHLTRAIEDLLAKPSLPAGVIIAGDLALTRGEPSDYQQLRSVLQPLRKADLPVCLALGNHDERENFWAGIQAAEPGRPLASSHVSVIPSKHANWFVLDTLEKTNSTPGLLGEAQLQWLGKALDARRGKPAIVLMHHNPWQGTGLQDSEELFAVLRPRRQVKAVIFGHTHRWLVAQDPSGIHEINLPPVAYVFQQGAPAGWIQAQLTDAGMSLTFEGVGNPHNIHGQTTRLEWRHA